MWKLPFRFQDVATVNDYPNMINAFAKYCCYFQIRWNKFLEMRKSVRRRATCSLPSEKLLWPQVRVRVFCYQGRASLSVPRLNSCTLLYYFSRALNILYAIIYFIPLGVIKYLAIPFALRYFASFVLECNVELWVIETLELRIIKSM